MIPSLKGFAPNESELKEERAAAPGNAAMLACSRRLRESRKDIEDSPENLCLHAHYMRVPGRPRIEFAETSTYRDVRCEAFLQPTRPAPSGNRLRAKLENRFGPG
jgi:hypothetical protein